MGSARRGVSPTSGCPIRGSDGFTSFNRYYFAQTGKEGAVIDERFNRGGFLADYFIEYLNHRQVGCDAGRERADVCYPVQGIFGPKAMIINELAGSGGDALPWYFRKVGIGPLVGKTTWGGVALEGYYPELMDGGIVTSPTRGAFSKPGW